MFNFTRERIRQIELRSLTKLETLPKPSSYATTSSSPQLSAAETQTLTRRAHETTEFVWRRRQRKP